MPYTPRLVRARMYRMPIGTFARIISTSPTPGIGNGDANGITANVMSAGMMEIIGARMK